MQIESITHRTRDQYITGITAGYCLLVISCYILSVLLSGTIWLKYEHFLHTYLELAFIFLLLSSFIIVFLTHEVNTNSSRIIGYGLLAVVIYNILHVNYYFLAKQYNASYPDISYIYWILSRYTESIILIVSLFRYYKPHINRFYSLLITISVIAGTIFAVNLLADKMPAGIIQGNVNNAGNRTVIGIEIFNLLIFAVAFFFIFKKYNVHKKIKHRYFSIAILFAIQAESCFALNYMSQVFEVAGHFLKLIYAYHLFMGIYSSAVKDPFDALYRSRKMLLESQNQLKKILNGLPVGIITFDRKGRVRFVNNMTEKLLECKAEDLQFKTMEQLEDKFKSDEGIKVKHKGYVYENFKGLYNEVMKIITLKNNRVSLDVTVFNYKNGALASFTDVKKEQELANLKVQSRTILNAISNCVAIIDNNRRVLNCNKALLELLEIADESKITGKNFDEIKKSLKFNYEAQYFNLSDKNKSEQNREFSLITSSGNKKEIIFHEAPVVNIDKEIIGYAIVLTDITELKKEQRKVLHQEKLAIIGQMGSGIVHETKNYLASIKGYCQLLSTKVKDENLLKYIHKIDNISEDVNKVVVEFLSLAKPTDNDAMDVVSLKEVIESMRYMLESPSLMKDVQMVLNLSEEEREIIANEVQIKQVILNMAKNAIEAMNNVREARLDISTRISDSGKEMVLTISDNGRGMSKESLSLLGTPFYTTKETGTGLGLSVCYRIIKDHGGRLDVVSDVGKGTSFSIYLPCFLKE